MRRPLALAALVLTLVTLAGCAFKPTPSESSLTAPPPPPARITGTALWRERMALPPGARLQATLEDASKVGAPAIVLGRTEFEITQGPPVPFEIVFDPVQVDGRSRLNVRAQVMHDGQLLFTSDTLTQVMGNTGRNHAELLLRRVGTAVPPAAPQRPLPDVALEGKQWTLRTLGGKAVVVPAGVPEPHVLLQPGGNQVSGMSGCNRMMGTYALAGASLRLGPIASSRMACAKGGDLERAFLKALQATARWQVQADRLRLLDARGRELATFERTPAR